MTTPKHESEHYAFALAEASALLADRLARSETNTERKDKKARVAEKKNQAIEEAFKTLLTASAPIRPLFLLKNLIATWTDNDRRLLLIDLAFGDPFSPYELKSNEKDFEINYTELAKEIGYEETLARSILATKKDALKAHHESRLWLLVLTGTAATLLFGVGGFIIAPAIAGAIGGAAGLSGIAALNYGLALLGGGSLAVGGLGMAGGMWIVTGVAAAAGGGLVTGGQILYSLGYDQARLELIKLQVTYKEVLLHNQIQTGKAKEAIIQLNADKNELEKILAEEKLLNESNSKRVTDLEKKVEAIKISLKWMDKAAA
jgi:hypothetical protein